MALILVLLFPSLLLTSGDDLNQPQIDPFEGAIVIPFEEGKNHAEQCVVAYGKIIATKRASSRTYLNFHKNFEVELSVSIDEKFYGRFEHPPHELYEGQWIAVAGIISGESGAPQIRATTPQQIAIIPEGESPEAWIGKRFRGTLSPEKLQATRRSPNLSAIRFGSFNILNLFDEKDDPYRDDEVMTTKSREDLLKVADRIRKLDADVLCLQEVENRPYLERFVRSMLPEMGYDHVVLLEANNQRGIDCAVISRLPVGSVTTYQHMSFPGPDGKTYRFQRDLLRVQVMISKNTSVDVYCVHLKSKYGGAELSEPIRQAEATMIRGIFDDVLAQNPDAEFFIAGDFNDSWESESLKTIRGSGASALWCGFEDIEEGQRITYNKEPYLSMIDFIMVSPALKKRYMKGTYKSLLGDVTSSGSDHNPISATFRFSGD